MKPSPLHKLFRIGTQSDQLLFPEKYRKENEAGVIVATCLVLAFLLLIFAGIANAEVDTDKYADAIYKAEGSKKAVVPYGMFFKGCSWVNEGYCRKIVKNTVFNTLVKYRSERCRENDDDITCLARRYCPLNDPRDTQGLNKNWAKNVKYFMEKLK